ncbi:MAG: dependent carboxyl methyltransferase [Mycobacterium sp.]|nr:dependent carboxyl methyltransferase [Mycobacterium sp.]
MPESSAVVRPEPMEGGGSYGGRSRLQAAGLQPAVALFRQAAGEIPLPSPPHSIVIADYGASTGHNSLLPISAAIDELRKRTRPEQPILVAHTDVPENDFTVMFQTLADDPDSYLRKDAAAFASAVGRSFYRQIIPSCSVTLGWTSWAVQWLSRAPVPIPDHVQVAYSNDKAVRAAYGKQAAQDWNDFVAFRGRELRPGGRLVVMTMAVDESGEFGYRPLLDGIVAVLAEMVSQETLSEDEVGRMSIPTVGRSEANFRAPFAPSGRFEALSIEHLKVFDAEDRFFDQFRLDKDAKAFGAKWAAFSRASLFPTLATALEGGPTDPRRAEFVDQLESRVAARLAAAPEPMQIPLAQLVLVKQRRAD